MERFEEFFASLVDDSSVLLGMAVDQLGLFYKVWVFHMDEDPIVWFNEEGLRTIYLPNWDRQFQEFMWILKSSIVSWDSSKYEDS